MAEDTIQAELERLRAENAALKARTAKGLSLRVSCFGESAKCLKFQVRPG